LDAQGNVYGTTETGGPDDAGSVFKITPDGTYTVLAFFDSKTTGLNPTGPLAIDAHGNLIGTTYMGVSGNGNVYSVNSSGKISVLYEFGNANSEGARPVAGVTLVGSQILGTTSQGGVNGYGTVYTFSH
jgi:uncharacterized repeat protein (TIGR03803 family)